jgi:arsenite oxidase small subunit
VEPTTEVQRLPLSRRGLLTAGAAGAAALATSPVAAEAKAGYPRTHVASVSELRANRPVRFDYPLKGQASVLLDMGHAVPGGVGPKKSIVAYSVFCQHMGCATEYRRKQREFFCPCHQSRYDPERLGALIQGLAGTGLPRVKLQVRNGEVFAVGVDGLIYGYRNNLHPGKKARGRS